MFDDFALPCLCNGLQWDTDYAHILRKMLLLSHMVA